MSVKSEKVANIIQKEITHILQHSLKDPKIGFVTITDVIVTNDLSLAKVYVSFLGQKEREEAGMKALARSKGFIRSELAKFLSMRKVCDLQFFIDESLKKGNHIEEIIRSLNIKK